jgi:hypothetical protein
MSCGTAMCYWSRLRTSVRAAIQELNRVVRADARVSAVLATIRDGIWIITPTPFA